MITARNKDGAMFSGFCHRTMPRSYLNLQLPDEMNLEGSSKERMGLSSIHHWPMISYRDGLRLHKLRSVSWVRNFYVLVQYSNPPPAHAQVTTSTTLYPAKKRGRILNRLIFLTS